MNPDPLWKRRFAVPIFFGTSIAAEMPSRGVAVTDAPDGRKQLFAWDVETGDLRQVTNNPTGVSEGWIAPDGQYLYYFHDQSGDERGHIYRRPYLGGEEEDLTPDLTPFVLRGAGFSANGRMFAFAPINTEGFHVYVLPLAEDGTPGAPRCIHQSDREVWWAKLSHGGDLIACQSTARAKGMRRYSTLVFDTATGKQIGELWDGAAYSVEPVAFAPVADDTRLLAHTTVSGYRRPVIWDPRTGARRDLDLPEIAGDVLPMAWSPKGQRILFSVMNQAVQQLYTYDLDTSTLNKLAHPGGAFGYIGGELGGVAYFASEDEIFAHWQDAAHPQQVIALDSRTGAQTRTLLTAEETPPCRPWRSVTFPASDGQTIQGWLSTPEGEGPFPTILVMHGGPHLVRTEIFSPFSQMWTDHGFAFCTINYRGSTSFGRPFQEQIWGDIGHWEVEDMVAARTWLVGNEIADPEAILLTGASYGGYLTLMGLGTYPDLWAGGVAVIAVADWPADYEDAAEALKGALRAWFAGAAPDDDPEQYAISSPITYAEHFKAPVLVIQGKNDSRTPARQMEHFETKMRALGKDIEVLWYESGHQGPALKQLMTHHERALHFAQRVLG